MEYFELCGTDSGVQCCFCLSCWAQENLHCTCGLCLNHTDEVRQLNRKRFDALSISNYVMKKGFAHGTRHGKSEEQTYYHKPYNAWKRCRKRTDESGENILAFLTDSSKMQDTVRLKKNLGGQKRSAKKWMTQLKGIILTRRRRRRLDRYRPKRVIQLNDSTFNGPMASRDDYKAAVALKNHLFRQSEDYQKPIPPQYQDRRREGCKFQET